MAIGLSCKKENDPITQEEPEPTEETPENSFLYSSNSTGKFEIWQRWNGSDVQVTNDAGMESWWPRMSPDGTKILCYRSSRSGNISDYSEAELWIMDKDGTNGRVLLEKGVFGWKQHGFANWAPDGDKIVLTAFDSTENWHIYTIDSDGTNPVKISSRPVMYIDPCFSPDGKQIACAAVAEGNENSAPNLDIFIISLEDGSEKQITSNPHEDKSPAWSADGKTIAYESLLDPGYLNIGKWTVATYDVASGETNNSLLDATEINLMPRFSITNNALYFCRLDRTSFNFRIFSKQLPNGAVSAETDEGHSSFGTDPY